MAIRNNGNNIASLLPVNANITATLSNAVISGGTNDYNDLLNKPDLTKYATTKVTFFADTDNEVTEEYTQERYSEIIGDLLDDVDELSISVTDIIENKLPSKAEVNHEHEEYLTEHQDISHLASIHYVDESIKEESDSLILYANGVASNEAYSVVNDLRINELINYATTAVLFQYDGSTMLTQEEFSQFIGDLRTELDELKSSMTSMVNLAEPTSVHYVDYTIDNSISTFSLRNNSDTTVGSGGYIPECSNGHDFIKITLLDGNETTDLNTRISKVNSIKVYYPEETTSISFADTKVKDVAYINLENVEELSFNNCAYLESVDLSKANTTGNCVNENTFENVSEECQITISKDWETSEEQSGFTGTYINPWKYYIKYTLEKSDYNIKFNNDFYIPKITTDDGSITNSNQDFILLEMYLTDGSIVTEDFESLTCNDIELIIAYYPENTINIKCPGKMTSLEYINIDNITDMSWMFNGCSYITRLDLVSEWDTSRVTNMEWMFRESALTSLNLSEWNTDNVTSMYGMFNGCSSLASLDVSGWNLSGVTSLYGMFDGCTSLQLLDLSSWNISNLRDTEMTFNYCTSLTRLDLSTWDTQKINSSSSMFNKLPEDVDWCYDGSNYQNWTLKEEQTGFRGTFPWNKQEENLTVAKYTFTTGKNILPTFNSGFTNYTKIDVDNGDGTTTRTISISKTDTLPTKISFQNKTTLLSVEELDTSNVTDMSQMFNGCTSLTSLDLSNFNTSNVTNMRRMFEGCTSLTSLDLSNFDTSKVTGYANMFANVPKTVDWNYNGTNYANFTLTEGQTGFSGTFPWNKVAEPDSPYYIEYCVKNDLQEFYNLRLGLTSEAEDEFVTLNGKFKLCIPAIRLNGEWCYDHLFYKVMYTGHEVLSDKYEDIENLKFYDILAIRIYYPEETEGIRFFSTENESSLVRSVDYLEPERFTTLAEAFSFCSHLEEFNIKEPLFNPTNVFEANHMFEYCNSLITLNLSGWNTSNVAEMSNMLNGIPEDIDWYYNPDENPKAYANWTLTEEQTGFSGTFPWNKKVPTIPYELLFYSNVSFFTIKDKSTNEILYEGNMDNANRGEHGGVIVELPETTKAFTIETSDGYLEYRIYDNIIADWEHTLIFLDEDTNAYYYRFNMIEHGLMDLDHPMVIYTIDNKFDMSLDEVYRNPDTGFECYYALPYIPDFENKLNEGKIEISVTHSNGKTTLRNTYELEEYNCSEVSLIRIIDNYPEMNNLNGIRFGNGDINDAVSIANNILCLQVPEVDDNIFSGCNYLEQINLQSESGYRTSFSYMFTGFTWCQNLKVLNLGFDIVSYGDFKGTLENLIVFGSGDTIENIENEREYNSFQGNTIVLKENKALRVECMDCGNSFIEYEENAYGAKCPNCGSRDTYVH